MRIGWAAACFGSIMGFSRLTYGLLVPAMRASLGGGLDTYRNIGAANLAGYFVGALLATRLAEIPNRPRINLIALYVMCAAIAACGLVHDLVTLGILRFLIGVASGVALTLTLALAVEGIDQAVRGRSAALIWAGGAASMALAGAGSLIFPLDGNGWRYAWIAMAALGAAVAFVYSRITRGSTITSRRQDDGVTIGLWSPAKYLTLALGYTAFGFGYICVLTFFGAALARAQATSLGLAVVILGSAGTVGAVAWGPLVDRFRNGIPVGLACSLCSLGAFAISRDSAPSVITGAFLLGLSFISVPAMIGALAQQREPAHRYARAFATLTSMLGIGQILGPFVGGFVAMRFGTTAALIVGAAALALAAILCSAYRRPVGCRTAYERTASAGLPSASM